MDRRKGRVQAQAQVAHPRRLLPLPLLLPLHLLLPLPLLLS